MVVSGRSLRIPGQFRQVFGGIGYAVIAVKNTELLKRDLKMKDKKVNGRYWDFGWQLVEGCTKVSPGCDNCWSMAKEKRFRKESGIVFHDERLNRPLKRKTPASYAIWNDLFHGRKRFI